MQMEILGSFVYPIFLPDNIAQDVLHRPNLTIPHIQGDRLNGFPLQLTHMPYHVLKKI